MGEFFTLLLIGIIIAGVVAGVLIFYISKKLEALESARKGDQSLQFLNQNMQALQQNVSERLDNASRVMMAVNNELGQMKEIGYNLKNIQEFLKSPKLRGNLGEQGLRELLIQALPTQYFDMQYTFRNGQTVDAIIHLDAGKISIDSKFPLENFNQMLKSESEEERAIYRRRFRDDFKKHVVAISKKYINPDEGTTDFAFMYIPSESIYFEVINNEHDLFEFAAREHIVISSPSTFFYYLRTIMLGLQGKRITEMSREILTTLKSIQQQSKLLGEHIGVLNKHLVNASKTMSQVGDHYLKLSEKIDKVDLLEESQTKLLEENYEKSFD